MKAILVKPDRAASVVEITEFAELCCYYNGFPETVYPYMLEKPFCMIVDNIGLRRNLRLNEFGSKLYGTEHHGNPIVGDIFIMKQAWGLDGYDLVGLTDIDIYSLIKTFSLNMDHIQAIRQKSTY